MGIKGDAHEYISTITYTCQEVFKNKTLVGYITLIFTITTKDGNFGSWSPQLLIHIKLGKLLDVFFQVNSCSIVIASYLFKPVSSSSFTGNSVLEKLSLLRRMTYFKRKTCYSEQQRLIFLSRAFKFLGGINWLSCFRAY